ncbi:Kynureninase [Candidatus Promineifilum breve]|uniref:Kynureninase n=1 Tax=Candidatus Promineifilum breve TaxID=1806508 RepID=A0A160T4E6_9CHLR|nr:kynureninase [Candidatus Promineifilum breve]CUS04936.2 Kynureninase [Candidatus Promineifilum breve]
MSVAASFSLAAARQLDAADPLTAFRERFVIDDPDLIYLDGNSLGRLPRATVARLDEVIQREWGQRLVRSWGEGWFEAAGRIGDKIARLVGAAEGEVILADSTSVNLYKLTLAALAARPDRQTILTDDLNFPSDLYILQSAAALTGRRVRVIPAADGIHGPAEAICAAINDDTALVSLSHTVFKSGYVYDMATITAAAHRAGALALWDLSHSAGSVLVDLHGAAADLAVGCTYKYLNGGPGAPAFLYVRGDLQGALDNPISGWIGQRDPFDFALDYAPAAGRQRFLSGTPPILSLAAVEPGVELLLEAGMAEVRARSVRLSEYLLALYDERLASLGFRLNSPRDPARRGSHISLGHEEGLRINLALIRDVNVLPDFRRPDNIRLGIAPLYTTFSELYEAVERLRRVVVERLYERHDAADLRVT